MAQEMEPRSGTAGVPAELQPYQGHVPDWYVPPVLTSRPEYTELHVPYRDDSDFGRWYHHIITPFRAMALGFLWATHPDNLVPMLFSIVVIIGIVLFLIVK